MSDSTRQFLRHTLATLAYRGGKTLRDAPAEFANFRSSDSSRTPLEILSHIGDLLEWALSICKGAEAWKTNSPDDWASQTARFFDALSGLDAWLASDEPLGCLAERLFQGPIADALTHVGQLAMLRRMSGAPTGGENFFEADITSGRVGAEQPRPRGEF